MPNGLTFCLSTCFSGGIFSFVLADWDSRGAGGAVCGFVSADGVGVAGSACGFISSVESEAVTGVSEEVAGSGWTAGGIFSSPITCIFSILTGGFCSIFAFFCYKPI